MSIYIKGMDMPKDCGECFVGNRTICSKHCPLIEVKESHGDLVDHSEIGEILIKALDECEISEADKGHVIRAVWTAPTVIESEVEE